MGHGHGEPKLTAEDIEIQKILARAETQTFQESPKYIASDVGGVAPVSLTEKFTNERQRLGPEFTEADRHWRIKWHQDQQLRDSEPFTVPALKHFNPIRRFYRAPLNIVEKQLAKVMQPYHAHLARNTFGRAVLIYFGFLVGWYNLKYNTNNWEKFKMPRFHHSREVILPGDSRYPYESPRTESWHHYDRGFHDRKALLNKD